MVYGQCGGKPLVPAPTTTRPNLSIFTSFSDENSRERTYN
jgi:hypothetical protein